MWINSCLLWYQSGHLWPDEKQAVPDIALMASSSKSSILRKELNDTHNLSQYSPVPHEFNYSDETNGVLLETVFLYKINIYCDCYFHFCLLYLWFKW
jgi:hypothetical protein